MRCTTNVKYYNKIKYKPNKKQRTREVGSKYATLEIQHLQIYNTITCI